MGGERSTGSGQRIWACEIDTSIGRLYGQPLYEAATIRKLVELVRSHPRPDRHLIEGVIRLVFVRGTTDGQWAQLTADDTNSLPDSDVDKLAETLVSRNPVLFSLVESGQAGEGPANAKRQPGENPTAHLGRMLQSWLSKSSDQRPQAPAGAATFAALDGRGRTIATVEHLKRNAEHSSLVTEMAREITTSKRTSKGIHTMDAMPVSPVAEVPAIADPRIGDLLERIDSASPLLSETASMLASLNDAVLSMIDDYTANQAKVEKRERRALTVALVSLVVAVIAGVASAVISGVALWNDLSGADEGKSIAQQGREHLEMVVKQNVGSLRDDLENATGQLNDSNQALRESIDRLVEELRGRASLSSQ